MLGLMVAMGCRPPVTAEATLSLALDDGMAAWEGVDGGWCNERPGWDIRPNPRGYLSTKRGKRKALTRGCGHIMFVDDITGQEPDLCLPGDALLGWERRFLVRSIDDAACALDLWDTWGQVDCQGVEVEAWIDPDSGEWVEGPQTGSLSWTFDCPDGWHIEKSRAGWEDVPAGECKPV